MNDAFKKHWIMGLVGGLMALVIAIVIYQQRNLSAPTPAKPLPPIGTPASLGADSPPIISLNSLNDLLQHGFTQMQVKLNATSDNKLVCIGKWDKDAPRIFQKYDKLAQALSYAEFTEHPTVNGQRPCTLESLHDWLQANPSAKLVIAPQRHPVQLLTQLADNMQDMKDRLIPLVHTPGQYKAMRKAGYSSIILSYPAKALKQNDDKKIDRFNAFAVKSRIYAAQMPLSLLLKSVSAKKLMQNHISIYVNTTDCAKLSQLQKKATLGLFAGPAMKSPCSAGKTTEE